MFMNIFRTRFFKTFFILHHSSTNGTTSIHNIITFNYLTLKAPIVVLERMPHELHTCKG